MNNEEEIFTRHYIENKPISLEFNEETISSNKRLLSEFKKYNIIAETNHYDIGEIDQDEKNQYFENVIDNTLKNNNLYCSYLDYFDKMWMNNKVNKSKLY
jgi:hypothetical protein